MSPELTEYLPIIIGAAVVAIIALFLVMRLNRHFSHICRAFFGEAAAKRCRRASFAPHSTIRRESGG